MVKLNCQEKGGSNMARKGENIFYRKDGRWEARYFKQYDENHRIIYGYVYGKTYLEAKKKKNEKLLCLNMEQKRKPRQKKTLNDGIDEWLVQKKLIVKESTYARYYSIVNVHIRPVLGNIKLSYLTYDKIVRFINIQTESRENKILTNRTIRDIVVVLKQILNYLGIYYKIISPKPEKKEISILKKEEQRKLEEYLMAHIKPNYLGILLSLYAGLRIGEVCALRWKDINLVERKIHINHTIMRIQDSTTIHKTKIIMGEPKTVQSKRTIPIPSCLLSILKKLKSLDEDYILTNTEHFIEPRTYYNHYLKVLRSLKIENHKYHTLRHTFATRCIELGFDPKTLCEILGHADIKITLSLYVHPSDDMKIKSMEKLTFMN